VLVLVTEGPRILPAGIGIRVCVFERKRRPPTTRAYQTEPR
jgi:hypothetical protein